MINNTITIECFVDLISEDDLTSDSLEVLISILSEIRTHTNTFRANTAELVYLSGLYSKTFQALPAKKQESLSSVMTMPVFFCEKQEKSNEF